MLKSLLNSDFEWLFDLLQTLGRGQIRAFEQAIQKHSQYISRFPAIMKEMTYLDQKVRIIAFLELIFSCGKDDRNLAFRAIAETC